jgi:hypothetical protein
MRWDAGNPGLSNERLCFQSSPLVNLILVLPQMCVAYSTPYKADALEATVFAPFEFPVLAQTRVREDESSQKALACQPTGSLKITRRFRAAGQLPRKHMPPRPYLRQSWGRVLAGCVSCGLVMYSSRYI